MFGLPQVARSQGRPDGAARLRTCLPWPAPHLRLGMVLSTSTVLPLHGRGACNAAQACLRGLAGGRRRHGMAISPTAGAAAWPLSLAATLIPRLAPEEAAQAGAAPDALHGIQRAQAVRLHQLHLDRFERCSGRLARRALRERSGVRQAAGCGWGAQQILRFSNLQTNQR